MDVLTINFVPKRFSVK